MKKYLILKTTHFTKFYAIDVNKNKLQTTHGMVGATGLKKLQSFASDNDCRIESEKLLQAKLLAGYTEESDAAVLNTIAEAKTYKQKWSELALTGDKSEWLHYLLFLADTPESHRLLEAVVNEIESVRTVGQRLLFVLRNGETILASSPGRPSYYSNFPDSFQTVVSYHEFIIYKNMVLGKNKLTGFRGYPKFDPVYQLLGGKTLKAMCPLRYGEGSCWIYHPHVKNSTREPALFQVNANGVSEIICSDSTVGALFLQELARKLNLLRRPQKENTGLVATDSHLDWWETLDKAWKRIFLKALNKKEASQLTLVEVVAARIEWLDCSDEKVQSLTPLIPLFDNRHCRIEKILLNNTEIEDISFLERARHLTYLDISNTTVKDVSPVKQILYLRADRCLQLDFTTVATLTRLKGLYIRETYVHDLNFLYGFHKLEELHLLGTNIHDKVLTQFKIKFTKERMVFNKKTALRTKPLRVDVHPEITDPLIKTLEEHRDYHPELALEAGEKLLKNGSKRRDHRKIQEDMIQICRSKAAEYINTNKVKFRFFSEYQSRLQYMISSRNFIQLRSVKDTADLNGEIQQAIRHVYLNKRSYDAFLEKSIKDSAFTSIDEFFIPLLKTRFHDITREDIKNAILHSDIFEFILHDEGMKIKMKPRKRQRDNVSE